jgi:hypothetical protein
MHTTIAGDAFLDQLFLGISAPGSSRSHNAQMAGFLLLRSSSYWSPGMSFGTKPWERGANPDKVVCRYGIQGIVSHP